MVVPNILWEIGLLRWIVMTRITIIETVAIQNEICNAGIKGGQFSGLRNSG